MSQLQQKYYLSKPCSGDDIGAMVLFLKTFITKYYNQEVRFSQMVSKNDRYTFCLLNSYIHYDNIKDFRERCLKSIRNAERYFDNGYKFTEYFDSITINLEVKKMIRVLIEQLKLRPNEL